ncbi:DUF1653 domain-containing protein [Burkholderia multivorans]|uniref:DUF1653 domain-containing protein n=1 Tax=Burkholderia multivorans TaxID=87883 RepID=UPI001C22D698|nr:DUF1653 domain-containing protein [Burkholderia multivorans]MBU9200099.1 DUF1653 domain-containing protein [Burkholderia multivorans]
MAELPRPTSEWRHQNGNRYTVLCIANEFTERPDKYPPTVVYQGLNGRIWSRPVSDWARSMTLVRDAADAPKEGAPATASPADAARAGGGSSFVAAWCDVIAQLPITREGGSVEGSNDE